MTRSLTAIVLLVVAAAAKMASGQGASQVYVISRSAPLMSAEKTIATVGRGQEFQVEQANGAWLLIRVTTPEGTRAGWIHKDHTRRVFLPPPQPLQPTRRGELKEIRPAMGRIVKAFDTGKFDEVLDDAEWAMTTVWQLYGTEHTIAATQESSLAEVYKAAHLFKQAERFYLHAAKYRAVHPIEDVRKQARFWLNVGELYLEQGKYAQAEPYYARATDEIVKKYGAEHLEVCRWRERQAGLYHSWGQLSKAEAMCQQNLQVVEAHYGKDHIELADRLNALAIVQAALNRNTEAEKNGLRALAIKEAALGAQHKDLVHLLTSVATNYLNARELPKAITTYERACKIIENNDGANALEMATPLLGLAKAHEAEGDYTRAETLFQRVLAVQESRLGPDHLDVSTTLRLLAHMYRDTNRLEAAAPLFERSVKIREALVDRDDSELAKSYLGLGMLYRSLHQYARAEPYYLRAVTIHESRPAEDRETANYGFVLNNLAGLYTQMEQYDKAEALYLRAIPLVERAHGPEHPETSLCVSCLASLYQVRKEYDKALPLYQRSLKACRARLHPNHPQIAAALNDLAWIYVNTGDWDQAIDAMGQASRITRYHIGRVLPGLTDKEQAQFLEARQFWFQAGQTLGVLKRDDPTAAAYSAEWLLNGKGVIQAALAERALMARDATQPELAKTVQRLREVQNAVAALTLENSKAEDASNRRQQIDQLTAEEQSLAKQIGQSRGAPQPGEWIELASVRKALPPDSVLIEIANTHAFDFSSNRTFQALNMRYVAWIVPAEGQGDVRIIELGPTAEIDALVRKYGEAMDGAAAEILDSGEAVAEQAMRKRLGELATRVLQPLESQIGRYRRWIISPDWMLWDVPWAALPLADGRWSIEDHAIGYVISGRDLIRSKAKAGVRPDDRSSAVIFADPDFDLDPHQAGAELRREQRTGALSMRGGPAASSAAIPSNWSRLAGTAQEAREIAPRLTALVQIEPKLFAQQHALEGHFKQLRQPPILVMSTHGYFLSDQSATAGGIENPLLRCGLVLAGANRRAGRPSELDDGILTGLEIVGTDLRGTELVVLSACETGLGQVQNGEGVAGLRQAFQLAGAHAVVATLWQIHDRESAELMSGFFTHLADGKSKADALRDAQLALIKARRERHGAAHPFFWAAFTLTGQ